LEIVPVLNVVFLRTEPPVGKAVDTVTAVELAVAQGAFSDRTGKCREEKG
jgi:hypothetical protein